MGGLDFLVEGFEGGELRGEAAFGGGVDDEDYFVAEGGEGEGLAFFCCEGVSVLGVDEIGVVWMRMEKFGMMGDGGPYCREA